MSTLVHLSYRSKSSGNCGTISHMAQPEPSCYPPSTATYLEGSLGSGKTTRAVAHTLACLQHTPSEQVLVVCSNHQRQQAFQKRLLAGLGAQQSLGQLPVYTYAGLVRQTLMDHWPSVEALLDQSFAAASNGSTANGQPQVRPILCGFEITERLLTWLVKQHRSQHTEAFQDFPGDDPALVHQLVRRLRLRAENRLTRQDMLERSQLLEEPCLDDMAVIEQQLDGLTTRLRMLDPARQLELFHRLLAKSDAVQAYLRGRTVHLVAEDLDETIPAQQDFLRWVMTSEHCQSVLLTVDVEGGSRRGYLNAYPYDWPALKACRPGDTVELTRNDAPSKTADNLLAWWKKTPQLLVKSETTLQPIRQCGNRITMLEAVVTDILTQTRGGRRAGDLAIVLPVGDGWTLPWLAHRLRRQGLPVQSLVGGIAASQWGPARALLLLAQWCHYSGGEHHWPLSQSEWRSLWVTLCPQWLAQPQEFSQFVQALSSCETPHPDWQHLVNYAPELATFGHQFEQSYMRVWAEVKACQGLGLIDALYRLFLNVVTPSLWPKSAVPEIDQLLQSATQYLTMAHRWESIRSQAVIPPPLGKAWLQAVKAGVIADTPAQPLAVDPNAIVLGTPQKLIDAEIHRPWMAWLDVGSRQWARSDSAPLYNAWVHSALWDKATQANEQDWLLDDDTQQRLIRIRAGHVTRTLALLATETIAPFASLQDDDARDLPVQTGATLADGLQAIQTGETVTHVAERATLRPDQIGVLDYPTHGMGTMAIAAVPGAGKTFVNVELVLELVSPRDGPPGLPADQILILTYMESAARTLANRLQRKLQSSRLPTVSTIHGLAFRILTEDDHYRHFPQLPEELAILDDYEQQQVLAGICNQLYNAHLTQAPISESAFRQRVQRAMVEAKYARLTPDDLANGFANVNDPVLTYVVEAYRQYVATCQQTGKLDFTDLILYAIKLLEDRPDIRARYQRQYRVIIEDEAQDSSSLLQQFIQLLGGDAPNLIRTGDTNQSITTTFSAADPSVFREFTTTADHGVQMVCSGRSAPEVMTLANAWLAYCVRHPQLRNAFVPVQMQPVVGYNPSLLEPIRTQGFATDTDERQWWVGEIHRWQQAANKEQRNDSMALLLSRNDEVLAYTKALQQAGIPAISLTEAVQEQAVFAIQRAFVQLLVKPSDLATQTQWVTTLKDTGLLFLPPFVDTEQSVGQHALATELAWLGENTLLTTPIHQLPTATLQRLAYDAQEFAQLAMDGDIPTVLMAIAHRYFQEASDRSNGILCALAVRRHLAELTATDASNPLLSTSPLEVAARYLDDLHHGRKLRKVFGDALEHQGDGVVQVMTLHKSKGQEFDRVGMPGLVAEEVKSKPEDELAALIRQLGHSAIPVSKPQTNSSATENNVPISSETALPAVDKTALIQEKIDERARLMYVGLTRAKRDLVLTTSKKVTNRFGKTREAKPSALFSFAETWLANPDDIASTIAHELGDIVAELRDTETPHSEAKTAEVTV